LSSVFLHEKFIYFSHRQRLQFKQLHVMWRCL